MLWSFSSSKCFKWLYYLGQTVTCRFYRDDATIHILAPGLKWLNILAARSSIILPQVKLNSDLNVVDGL